MTIAPPVPAEEPAKELPLDKRRDMGQYLTLPDMGREAKEPKMPPQQPLGKDFLRILLE
jgi:hypothetical protein